MRALCTTSLLLTLCLVGCSERTTSTIESKSAVKVPIPSEEPTEPPAEHEPSKSSLSDDLCADCHPEEVDAWRASPMGRSLGPAIGQVMQTLPAASIRHPSTGETFSVTRLGDGVHQSSAGVGYTAQWVIGSGAHTRSFLHRTDGRYFVLPLTWYAQRNGWDLSPGYEASAHPGFHRQAGAECLNCHSDPPSNQAGSRNRFVDGAPQAIGCTRCHQDAERHAERQSAGERLPIPFHEGMSPQQAADVCSYCHMQGVVRVLMPGRQWDDFMPGMDLADVVAVFARKTPGRSITIANQAERLNRSRCAQDNPKARQCTTCHSPHAARASDRNDGCRSCHDHGQKNCTEKHGGDCAACHMARTATSDIPHVKMTDHFIRRKPLSEVMAANDGGELVWLNRPRKLEPSIAAVVEGRAHAELARQTGARSDLLRALSQLQGAVQPNSKDVDAWLDLASLNVLAGQNQAAKEAADKAWSIDPALGRVALGVAEARFTAGEIEGASEALMAFLKTEGHSIEGTLLQAKLSMVRGDNRSFEQQVNRIDEMRPHRGAASNLRGISALTRGEWVGAIGHFNEAVRREPGNAQFWLNLCRAHLRLGSNGQAQTACARGQGVANAHEKANFGGAMARILLNNGEAGRAAQLAAPLIQSQSSDVLLVLGRLALERGRINDAVMLLDRAVIAEPNAAQAWLHLSKALARQGKTELSKAALDRARRYGAIDKKGESK